MGFYIETPENHNKAFQLVDLYGASITVCPASIADIPEGKTLICVVKNSAFDAAGIIYNEKELHVCSNPTDLRPKFWLLMDTEKVIKLCPRVENVLKGEART